MKIQAIQTRLLIELKGAYTHINTTEEKFGTSKTRGIVRDIASDITDQCKDLSIKIGTTVFFGKYEDTAPYTVDGVDYALIKLEEVGGVSNE